MSYISVKNLEKEYITSTGEIVHALSDINLDISEGEFISVVGPSGCGKSTLLKILSGLLAKTSGVATLNNTAIEGPRNDVGIVFQDPVLLLWRTVLQNTLLPSEILNLDSEVTIKRAKELINLVGLDGFEDKFPHELSGGMKQRNSIIRALIHDPSLLLMDEPFGALDEIVRDQLNEHFHRLWEQTHKTVLFVTHSIPEAAYLSTKIVVMSPRPGKINEIIESTLPEKRTLDIRETQEFLELSQRIRKGLRAGKSYD